MQEVGRLERDFDRCGERRRALQSAEPETLAGSLSCHRLNVKKRTFCLSLSPSNCLRVVAVSSGSRETRCH